MKHLLVAAGLFISVVFARSIASQEQVLTPITIAEYGEFPLYAPLYVAYLRGYFREEGLEVTIVPAGGDEKVFAAILGGSAQFGVGDPLFTAISGEKGRPGKIICGVLESIPAWGLAKNKNIKPFQRAQDLKGLSLATYPGPSTSYTLGKQLFQLGGVAPNIKQVAYGSTLAALEAGSVDIILEYEPVVSKALVNGAHTVFSISDYFPHFALTGLSVLPEYLEAHPEIAQKVVNAFQRALNDIHKDIRAASALVSKRFPEIEPAVLERAFLQSQAAGSFPKSCVVSRKGWDVAVQLRRDVGDLKGEAPYDHFVDQTFASNPQTP